MERFAIMESWEANESNRIAEVAAASGLRISGILDEKLGGVIAYVEEDMAESIVALLNR
jgi:hypothetical protein